MIHRDPTDLPDDVYPDDPWALVEDSFGARFLYLTETIFALSNGYVGVRGTQDEGHPSHVHGTFVNRFHETWPIVHAEKAYGFAKTGQTIVNVPDATVVEVTVDDETFDLSTSEILAYRRWLDFRSGVLERRIRWRTREGTTVEIGSRRLASLALPHVVAFETVLRVDRPADVALRSRMVNRQDRHQVTLADIDDPRRAQDFPHKVLNPRASTIDGLRVVQGWVTTNSGQGLLTGLDHRLEGARAEVGTDRDAEDFGFRIHVRVEPGRPVALTKIAVYRACPETPSVPEREAVSSTLDRAMELGFDGLAVAQREDLDRFWARSDIEVDAGPEIQQAIRWTLFQLHQASACLDGASIPAKGLTGQAYDGHYFWDTEIYVLPFLVYTSPGTAAGILRFRHSILGAARDRAAELSQRGALFPWRTITGEEASAYFLAGTAQYHIDADIVYALRKYVDVTGDDELLWDVGAELAVETARMWADLGFMRGNRFHIHGVTGPDEYTALVDDNAYTNAMARMNLRFAAEAVRRMRDERPARHAELADRLGLEEDEPGAWLLAADAMYVPHDPTLGITPQDHAFLSKEPWDFRGTPASRYPLLLHYHPLVIYRFQVLKQADVVLADFLLGDEFPAELKKANYDYYDPITTGDSSLSASVQAIMAAEIGYLDQAMEHFEHALFMDLADLSGNTTDGVHMASAGGVWMALVYGFGGLRDHRGRIGFDPRLPDRWRTLRFRLTIAGRLLAVEITHDAIRLDLTGDPIDVHVREVGYTLREGTPTTAPLA